MTTAGGFRRASEEQITFDYVDRRRVGAVGSDPSGDAQNVAGLAGRALPGRGRGVRGWRAAPGGGMSAEELGRGRGGWCIWAIRPRSRRCGGRRSAPRPTVPMRGCCARLLLEGRFPESWIPPAHVLEMRTLGRLYCALMDERRAWQQRIHAQLFHQGCPPIRPRCCRAAGREAVGRRRAVAGRVGGTWTPRCGASTS